MIQQLNPDRIFSGEGKDSIGPGQYNINREIGNTYKGVDWHSSNVEKGLNEKIQRNEECANLGPGRYNVEKLTGCFARYKKKKIIDCSPLGGRRVDYS